MKTRNILFALAISVFAGVFSACQNDNEILDNVAVQQEVKFAISVGDKPGYGAATRANAAGWEDGDKIYAFFDVTSTTDRETRQVELTYDAATSTWKAVKKEGEWEFKASGTFSCVSFKDKSWKFSDGRLYNYDEKGSIYGYLFAKDVAYTYDSTTKTVTANITFKELENDVKFVVSGINGYDVVLSCYQKDADDAILKQPTTISCYSNFYESGGADLTSSKYLWASEGNVYYAKFVKANTNDIVVRLNYITYGKKWEKTFPGKTLKAKSEIHISAPTDGITGNVGDIDNGWTRVAD